MSWIREVREKIEAGWILGLVLVGGCFIKWKHQRKSTLGLSVGTGRLEEV
jgi:hypothetical protein